YRFDASAQELQAVPRRHDQADQRLGSGGGQPQPVERGADHLLNACGQADALDMRFKRAPPRLPSVALLGTAGRCRAGNGAPVVKNPGYVTDMTRLDALDDAKIKVVVLA